MDQRTDPAIASQAPMQNIPHAKPGTTRNVDRKTKPTSNQIPVGVNATASSAKAKVSRRLSAEERQHMIAEAAYYLAEKRGFCSDCVQDWLAAEVEIESIYPS